MKLFFVRSLKCVPKFGPRKKYQYFVHSNFHEDHLVVKRKIFDACFFFFTYHLLEAEPPMYVLKSACLKVRFLKFVL